MTPLTGPRPHPVQRWSAVLWPSFLVSFATTAAALTLLDLRAMLECALPHAGPIEPLAAYSVTFFVLWAVGAAASALATYFASSE